MSSTGAPARRSQRRRRDHENGEDDTLQIQLLTQINTPVEPAEQPRIDIQPDGETATTATDSVASSSVQQQHQQQQRSSLASSSHRRSSLRRRTSARGVSRINLDHSDIIRIQAEYVALALAEDVRIRAELDEAKKRDAEAAKDQRRAQERVKDQQRREALFRADAIAIRPLIELANSKQRHIVTLEDRVLLLHQFRAAHEELEEKQSQAASRKAMRDAIRREEERKRKEEDERYAAWEAEMTTIARESEISSRVASQIAAKKAEHQRRRAHIAALEERSRLQREAEEAEDAAEEKNQAYTRQKIELFRASLSADGIILNDRELAEMEDAIEEADVEEEEQESTEEGRTFLTESRRNAASKRAHRRQSNSVTIPSATANLQQTSTSFDHLFTEQQADAPPSALPESNTNPLSSSDVKSSSLASPPNQSKRLDDLLKRASNALIPPSNIDSAILTRKHLRSSSTAVTVPSLFANPFTSRFDNINSNAAFASSSASSHANLSRIRPRKKFLSPAIIELRSKLYAHARIQEGMKQLWLLCRPTREKTIGKEMFVNFHLCLWRALNKIGPEISIPSPAVTSYYQHPCVRLATLDWNRRCSVKDTVPISESEPTSSIMPMIGAIGSSSSPPPARRTHDELLAMKQPDFYSFLFEQLDSCIFTCDTDDYIALLELVHAAISMPDITRKRAYEELEDIDLSTLPRCLIPYTSIRSIEINAITQPNFYVPNADAKLKTKAEVYDELKEGTKEKETTKVTSKKKKKDSGKDEKKAESDSAVAAPTIIVDAPPVQSPEMKRLEYLSRIKSTDLLHAEFVEREQLYLLRASHRRTSLISQFYFIRSSVPTAFDRKKFLALKWSMLTVLCCEYQSISYARAKLGIGPGGTIIGGVQSLALSLSSASKSNESELYSISAADPFLLARLRIRNTSVAPSPPNGTSFTNPIITPASQTADFVSTLSSTRWNHLDMTWSKLYTRMETANQLALTMRYTKAIRMFGPKPFSELLRPEEDAGQESSTSEEEEEKEEKQTLLQQHQRKLELKRIDFDLESSSSSSESDQEESDDTDDQEQEETEMHKSSIDSQADTVFVDKISLDSTKSYNAKKVKRRRRSKQSASPPSPPTSTKKLVLRRKKPKTNIQAKVQTGTKVIPSLSSKEKKKKKKQQQRKFRKKEEKDKSVDAAPPQVEPQVEAWELSSSSSDDDLLNYTAPPSRIYTPAERASILAAHRLAREASITSNLELLSQFKARQAAGELTSQEDERQLSALIYEIDITQNAGPLSRDEEEQVIEKAASLEADVDRERARLESQVKKCDERLLRYASPTRSNSTAVAEAAARRREIVLAHRRKLARSMQRVRLASQRTPGEKAIQWTLEADIIATNGFVYQDAHRTMITLATDCRPIVQMWKQSTLTQDRQDKESERSNRSTKRLRDTPTIQLTSGAHNTLARILLMSLSDEGISIAAEGEQLFNLLNLIEDGRGTQMCPTKTKLDCVLASNRMPTTKSINTLLQMVHSHKNGLVVLTKLMMESGRTVEQLLKFLLGIGLDEESSLLMVQQIRESLVESVDQDRRVLRIKPKYPEIAATVSTSVVDLIIDFALAKVKQMRSGSGESTTAMKDAITQSMWLNLLQSVSSETGQTGVLTLLAYLRKRRIPIRDLCTSLDIPLHLIHAIDATHHVDATRYGSRIKRRRVRREERRKVHTKKRKAGVPCSDTSSDEEKDDAATSESEIEEEEEEKSGLTDGMALSASAPHDPSAPATEAQSRKKSRHHRRHPKREVIEKSLQHSAAVVSDEVATWIAEAKAKVYHANGVAQSAPSIPAPLRVGSYTAATPPFSNSITETETTTPKITRGVAPVTNHEANTSVLNVRALSLLDVNHVQRIPSNSTSGRLDPEEGKIADDDEIQAAIDRISLAEYHQVNARTITPATPNFVVLLTSQFQSALSSVNHPHTSHHVVHQVKSSAKIASLVDAAEDAACEDDQSEPDAANNTTPPLTHVLRSRAHSITSLDVMNFDTIQNADVKRPPRPLSADRGALQQRRHLASLSRARRAVRDAIECEEMRSTWHASVIVTAEEATDRVFGSLYANKQKLNSSFTTKKQSRRRYAVMRKLTKMESLLRAEITRILIDPSTGQRTIAFPRLLTPLLEQKWKEKEKQRVQSAHHPGVAIPTVYDVYGSQGKLGVGVVQRDEPSRAMYDIEWDKATSNINAAQVYSRPFTPAHLLSSNLSGSRMMVSRILHSVGSTNSAMKKHVFIASHDIWGMRAHRDASLTVKQDVIDWTKVWQENQQIEQQHQQQLILRSKSTTPFLPKLLRPASATMLALPASTSTSAPDPLDSDNEDDSQSTFLTGTNIDDYSQSKTLRMKQNTAAALDANQMVVPYQASEKLVRRGSNEIQRVVRPKSSTTLMPQPQSNKVTRASSAREQKMVPVVSPCSSASAYPGIISTIPPQTPKMSLPGISQSCLRLAALRAEETTRFGASALVFDPLAAKLAGDTKVDKAPFMNRRPKTSQQLQQLQQYEDYDDNDDDDDNTNEAHSSQQLSLQRPMTCSLNDGVVSPDLSSLINNTSNNDNDSFAAAMQSKLASFNSSRHDAPDTMIRCKFIDDVVIESVEMHGVTQIVMLGAGLDTRAYRLRCLSKVDVYELDVAGVIAYKVPLLADEPLLAKSIRRIVCDFAQMGGKVQVSKKSRTKKRLPTTNTATASSFEADDVVFSPFSSSATASSPSGPTPPPWCSALLAGGFDPSQPTLWIAEGLLMYLGVNQVSNLLGWMSYIASAGECSGRHHLVADIMNENTVRSKLRWYRYFRWGAARTGTSPSSIGPFLRSNGWCVSQSRDDSLDHIYPIGRDGLSYGRYHAPPLVDSTSRPNLPPMLLETYMVRAEILQFTDEESREEEEKKNDAAIPAGTQSATSLLLHRSMNASTSMPLLFSDSTSNVPSKHSSSSTTITRTPSVVQLQTGTSSSPSPPLPASASMHLRPAVRRAVSAKDISIDREKTFSSADRSTMSRTMPLPPMQIADQPALIKPKHLLRLTNAPRVENTEVGRDCTLDGSAAFLTSVDDLNADIMMSDSFSSPSALLSRPLPSPSPSTIDSIPYIVTPAHHAPPTRVRAHTGRSGGVAGSPAKSRPPNGQTEAKLPSSALYHSPGQDQQRAEVHALMRSRLDRSASTSTLSSSGASLTPQPTLSPHPLAARRPPRMIRPRSHSHDPHNSSSSTLLSRSSWQPVIMSVGAKHISIAKVGYRAALAPLHIIKQQAASKEKE